MISKLLAPVVLIAFSATVQAADYQAAPSQDDSTNLARIDVLQTCASTKQKAAAEKVLNFMFNYKWWHIKNMYNAIHKDFTSWHASRVYMAVVNPPEKWDKLPFKKGLVTKDMFIADLAMISFTNDVPQYKIAINRAECLGDDTVVLSTVFNGVSVLRDADGYITHKVPLTDLPTRFMFVLKNGLVYKLVMDLPESATVDLWKKFREVAGTPALPKDENTRTTFAEILARFKKEAGLAN